MFRTPLEWTVASLRLTHEKEIENLDIDWELQLRLRAVPPRENIPSKSFRPDRSEGIRYSKGGGKCRRALVVHWCVSRVDDRAVAVV
jgi:hypothetical protein